MQRYLFHARGSADERGLLSHTVALFTRCALASVLYNGRVGDFDVHEVMESLITAGDSLPASKCATIDSA